MDRPSRAAALRATIADVAREAGVHPSTVSRALTPSARHRISEAVAARVTEAATRLGYRASALASGLRSGRSHTIGVLVPDLTNPVFPPIVEAIEAELAREGYITLLANTAGDPERERLLVERMAAQGADGLILASAARGGPAVQLCERLGLPAVLVNRRLPGAEVPSVVSDDAGGMRLAVEHLLALGHRRIAHLAGPTGTSTAADRSRGLRAALRDAGLDPVASQAARAYTREAGRAAAERLLASGGFTAIAAANDLLALGAYDAVAAAGLTIPASLSVTGFNDMPLVDMLAPPLTTIRIQYAAMGTAAAGLLLGRLRDDTEPCRAVRLTPTLVRRGSTAAPPGWTIGAHRP